MVTRVKVGAEVVASDSTTDSTLNVEHPLSGNLVLFPLRHGIRRDTESLGQLSLGAEDGKDSLEGMRGSGTGVVLGLGRDLGSDFHANKLNRRLSLVNCRLIAEHESHVDHQHMVDTPKPEHYSAFKDWLEAFRASRNLLQADIAEIAGVSAQAVTKWFSGGGVQTKALKKLASAAGVPYAHLRMLVEGQPIGEGRQKRGMPPPSPAVQRIARKIELLAADETKITAVEAMIDALIAQQSKERRRGDKVA